MSLFKSFVVRMAISMKVGQKGIALSLLDHQHKSLDDTSLV